jgi:hypothetical protein
MLCLATGQARNLLLRHLALADSAVELARALVSNDLPGLGHAAWAIEGELEEEPIGQVRARFGMLERCVCIRADPARRPRRVFAILRQHWPAHAVRTLAVHDWYIKRSLTAARLAE